jgi:hypothetical protein
VPRLRSSHAILYVCSHSDSISSLLIVAVNITGDVCGPKQTDPCLMQQMCGDGVCLEAGGCRVVCRPTPHAPRPTQV